MARITVDDSLKNVKNRFELVLLAAKRARDLTMTGVDSEVPWNKDKPSVVALREIAIGKIKPGYLDKKLPEARAVEAINQIDNSDFEVDDDFNAALIAALAATVDPV